MGQTLSRKDRILAGGKVAFPTKSEQILMKHVAEGGGSGGGLQFEQIGTEHNGHWFDSRGQCKIKYYQLGGTGSCLFVIRIDASGPPVALNTITDPFVIDDNPNILATDIMGNCNGFVGGVIASNGSADFTRLFVGMNTNTKKLHVLPDSTNTGNIAAINTYLLVIAKLADNIT